MPLGVIQIPTNDERKESYLVFYARELRKFNWPIFIESVMLVLSALSLVITLVVARFTSIPTLLWNILLWGSIIGIGSFSLAIIVGGVVVPFLRDYRQLKEELEPDAKQGYFVSSRLYGMCRPRTEFLIEIDSDGSAQIKNDVRVLATTERLHSLEHYTRLILPHGSPLSGELIGFEAHGNSPVKVTQQIVQYKEAAIYWKVNFTPALPPLIDTGRIDESEAGYYCVVKQPASSYAMTSEELSEKGEPYEFYTAWIGYPTEFLVLKVVFPKQFNYSDPRPDVWLGGLETRLPHDKEYTRIISDRCFRDGREPDGCPFLRLELLYPIVGLVYGIKWNPIDLEMDKNIS